MSSPTRVINNVNKVKWRVQVVQSLVHTQGRFSSFDGNSFFNVTSGSVIFRVLDFYIVSCYLNFPLLDSAHKTERFSGTGILYLMCQ